MAQQLNARRLKTQQSFTSSTSIPTADSSSAEQSTVTMLETTMPKTAAMGTAAAVSQKYGIHAAANRNKQAMQKLANNFVELNKRKAEKRDQGQSTWRNLIKGVLDLQRGKIPLLLAVEAGNQSMCRELLSSQTAEQLKVKQKRKKKSKRKCDRFRSLDLIAFFVFVFVSAGNY